MFFGDVLKEVVDHRRGHRVADRHREELVGEVADALASEAVALVPWDRGKVALEERVGFGVGVAREVAAGVTVLGRADLGAVERLKAAEAAMMG